MSGLTPDPELAQLYQPTLLVSDSQRSYSTVRDAFLEHIKPGDFIEHMRVAELIDNEWETLRIRKFKSLIVGGARHQAVHNLLSVLLRNNDASEIDDLAERFFTTKIVRRKVEAILHRFGLNAANIDAEALRCSLPDLAEINRRLTELGSRRDRILQRIEDERA